MKYIELIYKVFIKVYYENNNENNEYIDLIFI